MTEESLGYMLSDLFGFQPKRYTGRVVETGYGPYSDSFDGKKFAFMTVDIPQPAEKVGDEWGNRTFKIYINGDVPQQGELVDLKFKRSFGIPEQIGYIKASNGGERIEWAKNFEDLTPILS